MGLRLAKSSGNRLGSHSSVCTLGKTDESSSVPDSPPNYGSSFGDINFSSEDISLLRTSFDILKLHRDEIALELLNKILEIDEAAEKYRKAHRHVGSSWAVLGLGIIMMSGLERCILRIHGAKNLAKSVDRLITFHQHIDVSPELMVAAIKVSQPVIMAHLRKQHDCQLNENGGECYHCKCWEKFFATTIHLFSNKPSNDSVKQK